MPEIGTVTKGIEIGRAKANLFIWQACDQCGKERWVRLIRGIPKNTRCLTCERKTITHATGEKAHNWTGGKAKNHAGYVLTILQPDDFFFPMTSRRTKRANYSWSIV